jgi:hypothetical protein
MQEAAHPVLAAWSNFYVIIGSSAAALTGLMFVVITLVAGRPRVTTQDGLATFSTPTVVHFCAALLVSAILAAPWRSLVYPAVLLGLTGLYGVVYVSSLMLRTKRLTTYRAETEDWVWYSILPLVAYAAVVVVAVLLPTVPAALFVLGGAALLLIFVGIHNAWDVVTFLAVDLADGSPGAISNEKPRANASAAPSEPETTG